jgi:DNA polymerase-3 subunit beta
VKLVATARPLADALAIAAALAAHDKRAKDFAALGAIQITADSRSKVSANVLHFAVEHAFPATMIEPGVLAVSGARLTALVSGFPDTAEIEISTDSATGRITHRRSRFNLEAIPTGDIPRALTLDEETSRIVLPRADAVKLFAKPAFAIGDEASRYYLCGIFLHNIDDGLAAVCTDGTRLCRFVLPGYAGLSQERTFIVPAAAARIASRLLADKANDTVTLRRSRTLFALEGACFSFVSKLIDGNFPDYERIIPSPSNAAVTVNRKSSQGRSPGS